MVEQHLFQSIVLDRQCVQTNLVVSMCVLTRAEGYFFRLYIGRRCAYVNMRRILHIIRDVPQQSDRRVGTTRTSTCSPDTVVFPQQANIELATLGQKKSEKNTQKLGFLLVAWRAGLLESYPSRDHPNTISRAPLHIHHDGGGGV